jgi:hypothetical protein
MKPLILVIGGTKAGKSTIISSLTGCKHHSFIGEVEDKSNGKIIYVICSSQQEETRAAKKYKDDLDYILENTKIIGLVMASRSTKSLETIIIRAQEKKKFKIYPFFITSGYQGGKPKTEQVRAILHRCHIRPHILDGKRFAFLNAAEICKITGIPN